ncbi:cytosolic Fe-S cluster assembly factor cfd1 [Arachnomyces sp. PD_36]|nr:cytosolic Fe-S cluster assembly factor cfd1 [Arachnomyces sp. PD_36]
MPLEGIKNIVLVLSGKGGVGKSSVTLQLALALSLQGRSVGILDVDLTGPSIPRLVGLEDAKITQAPGGWVPVTVHPAGKGDTTASSTTTPTDEATTTQTPRKTQPRGSLRCMSLGFLLRDRGDAVIWRGPKKTAMVRQFLTDVLWGETDYLLIDTPPGTSDEHIALAEQLLTLSTTSPSPSTPQTPALPTLAGAILVTTPQAISTADVRKELNFCQKTKIPVLGVVENMAGYACPCCGEVSNVFSKGGGRVMAGEMGVPFLGEVPVDVGFGEMVEGRKVLVDGEEEEGSATGGGVVVLPKGEGEEGRLLVDKYKDCWSFPIFEGFSKTLLEKIEGPVAT